MTGRTDYGVAACVARAVASRTLLGAVDRDVCSQSRHGLLERERQRHLDVLALLRHRARRLSLGLTAAAAEEFREDVAEAGAATRGRSRRVGAPVEAREVERHAATRARRSAASGSAARGGVCERVGVLAEAVVDLTLLRVGQDLVRFGDALETLLRRLVARVHVRMVLAREPPVSLLDLLRLRVPLDTQNLVEVFFRHLPLAGETG